MSQAVKDDEILDFAFSQPEVVVLPIEHLSTEGLSDAFAEHVREDGRLSSGHLLLFDAAFATWWRRVAELARRAPRQWLPPRLQHVIVVTRPEAVHPFSQPLHRSSWRLEASDFDPEISNLEFASYQLAHAERLGISGSATDALGQNLSYLLSLSDAQLREFCSACANTPRSDGAGYRALAEALPQLRAEARERQRSGKTRDAADSVLPGLLESWTRAAGEAMDRYASSPGRAGDGDRERFFDWIRERRPEVLLLSGAGSVLWDPDRSADATSNPAAALDAGASETWSHDGLARVQADIECIDARSRRFLAAVKDVDALPLPGAETSSSGLCYLLPGRHRIAYDLDEAQMRRRWWRSPPFESFMLGARTLHEWGHLAGLAGFVRVPPERSAAREAALEELEELFREIHRDAPAAIREVGRRDLASLCGGDPEEPGADPGTALAEVSLARLSDFEANSVAARFLPGAELQTYVRSNVVSHSLEMLPSAVFRLLARSAFEAQYLKLIGVPDPEAYFLESTWFRPHFLEAGVLSPALARRLFATVSEVLSHHELDESRFHPSSL